MIHKVHRLCIAVVVGCTVLPIHAAVNIGPNTIFKGTTIEVNVPGPDLQAIIDGITDAASENPYLIKLGAGQFTLDDTLVMAPYISIMGSGQGVTVLKGAISTASGDATSSVVDVANNVALTDLSVENTGGSSWSIAVRIFSKVNTRIERISAMSSGASVSNYAIYYISVSSTAFINNVSAVASGGANASGITNSGSSPLMTNIIATALGAASSRGVLNESSSSPIMTNTIATASGGTNNNGVINNNSSPTMVNLVATGSGGTNNWGVFNSDSASAPRIDSSILTGATNGMQFAGSTGTRITNTQIVGGIDANPAGVQCRDVYDAALTTISC